MSTGSPGFSPDGVRGQKAQDHGLLVFQPWLSSWCRLLTVLAWGSLPPCPVRADTKELARVLACHQTDNPEALCRISLKNCPECSSVSCSKEYLAPLPSRFPKFYFFWVSQEPLSLVLTEKLHFYRQSVSFPFLIVVVDNPPFLITYNVIMERLRDFG